MNNTFTEIDTANWERAQLFHYFARMAPTSYSLTVQMDVTKLYCGLKEKGLRFFPTYLWLVTRSVNRRKELRMAVKDGKLGYYESLTPMYANFHKDTKEISFLWTEFEESYRDFYQAFLETEKKYGEGRGVLGKPEMPPATAYTVSCIPWVDFGHFAVHSGVSAENNYFFPSIESGKITEKNGRKWMPLSITCHHAVTDGYHVKQFVEGLQADMDHMEEWEDLK